MISDVLNKFPEVRWDRFSEDGRGKLSVFGWIKRDDDRSDFLLLFFEDGRLESLATSSAKNSKDFSRRAGMTHHDCRRVENSDLFQNVKNMIKLEADE